MTHVPQALVVLLEPEDLRQTLPEWPSIVCLAVGLMRSGDLVTLLFRREERMEIPSRIIEMLRLDDSEVDFVPEVPGFATRSFLYSDERRLMGLIAANQGLLDEADDYMVNYTYALEEGLDPALMLGELSGTAQTPRAAGIVPRQPLSMAERIAEVMADRGIVSMADPAPVAPAAPAPVIEEQPIPQMAPQPIPEMEMQPAPELAPEPIPQMETQPMPQMAPQPMPPMQQEPIADPRPAYGLLRPAVGNPTYGALRPLAEHGQQGQLSPLLPDFLRKSPEQRRMLQFSSVRTVDPAALIAAE